MYSTAEPSARRFDELALSMYTYYDEDPFYESLYLIDIDDEGTKHVFPMHWRFNTDRSSVRSNLPILLEPETL